MLASAQLSRCAILRVVYGHYRLALAASRMPSLPRKSQGQRCQTIPGNCFAAAVDVAATVITTALDGLALATATDSFGYGPYGDWVAEPGAKPRVVRSTCALPYKPSELCTLLEQDMPPRSRKGLSVVEESAASPEMVHSLLSA